MHQIIIIGGGLSGRLLALNLLLQAPGNASVSVRIIDRGGKEYMGPAYSNDSSALLLNVPAEQMGAFSDDPGHFCKWAREQGRRVEAEAFLPRSLFRDYIFSLMRDAIQQRAGGVDFDHIRGEVTDLSLDGSSATVYLEGSKTYTADQVVLALGNFPPRRLPIDHSSVYESDRYIRNPWDASVLDSLSRDDRILFIGTGQTMVDLTLLLRQQEHQGTITAISRRGLLPLAHRQSKPYPSFFEEIKGSKSLPHIFKTVHKHANRAKKLGIDERAVIDSMRPDTQELWSGLPRAEKRRFMRHAFRYWERIRSRIPPQNEKFINELLNSGQLRVLAGRINDLEHTQNELRMYYTPRYGRNSEVEIAEIVINCIGPETDYRKVEHPLIKNLLRRGTIRPGHANLGMDTLTNGAILNKGGTPSRVLYTLGSTMKGLVWEVLAVPDIRVQAEKLASLLLDN